MDYFIINHLLPLPFNLAWGPTLLSKNVVSRLVQKEFLFRCLEQFTVYIWMFVSLVKMNACLIKILEEIGIEIDLQRIMGLDLYRINKHFL
jgi:hypothetical protein